MAYNGSSKINCVWTEKKVQVGLSIGDVGVGLYKCTQTTPGPTCTRSGSLLLDVKAYKYYAGPLTVYAPSQCIHAFGIVQDPSANVDITVDTAPVAGYCA